MNCEQIQALLPVFIDNELPEEEKQTIQVHLTGCAQCRSELQERKRVWNMLGTWKDREPETGYVARFWAGLSTRTPLRVKIFDWLREKVQIPQLVPVLAAAIVFLAVGFLAMQNYVRIQETETLLTKLPVEEVEMIDNIELAENYDVIQDMDFLEDMEILERISPLGS